MEQEDEKKLTNKIIEIENRCLSEELDMIIQTTKVQNRDIAYNLLMSYKNIWEFTANVSSSGDSFVISLPKKEAKKRGIQKGSPVFLALKKLRFLKTETN